MKQQLLCSSQIKKHQRIKSQQIVTHHYNTQSSSKQFFKLHSRNRNFQECLHLIELRNPDTGQSQIVQIDNKSSLKQVKQVLNKALQSSRGAVYFYSLDQNEILDYCLEEGVGKLSLPKILNYQLVDCEHDSRGNFIQSSEINDYSIYSCLSVGGFSKVFLVRSKRSGRFYAAKFVDKNFDKSEKFKELIYNERYINQILEFKFLVKMHRFIQTQSFYVFILDYCPSGELFCLMKAHREMSESEAKFYFIETLLAIEYMHSKNVIYRDIKPENILLDKNGHIKIADFGLSKVMREKSNSYCGSLQYMAPEIVLGMEHSFGVDHYCLGSLLFEIMVGCPPFYNPNFTPAQTKYHIVNSTVKFPTLRKLSNQLVDLISRLLDKNPRTRLGSLGGIREILAHPWVGKFDRTKYENYEINPPYQVSLNKSNFQTAFLPNESIQEVRIRINRQIQQKNRQTKIIPKGEKKQQSSFTSNTKDRVRFKSTDMAIRQTRSRSPKGSPQNPYQRMMLKNSGNKKREFKQSKNSVKNELKTFHVESNLFFKKARSLTKNFEKDSRLSTQNEGFGLGAKKINPKQTSMKMSLAGEEGKRNLKATIYRKSGNGEKENVKVRFEKKSKQLRELFGKNTRNSVNEEKQEGEKVSFNNKIEKQQARMVYQ